jgi:hypothetical protein
MTEPRRPARPGSGTASPRPMGVRPVLVLSLRYGLLFAAAVAVVACVVGVLIDGVPGLVGGLLGAIFAAVYLALTAVTMLIAGRVVRDDPLSPVFYGIIMVAWFVKIIVFVILVLWLRTQTWFDPRVLFVTLVIVVLGSLILDCVAFVKARVPYVEVDLPDAGSSVNPDAAGEGHREGPAS